VRYPIQHTQRVLSSSYGVCRFPPMVTGRMVSPGLLCLMEPDEIVITVLAVIAAVVAIGAMVVMVFRPF
jgi:hypothetical protein